jgi:K+-sensing histidine kinase KdpD
VQRDNDATPGFRDVGLLRSVAQQLTFPLTAIARQAELSLLTGDPSAVDIASIRAQAQAALTLVDSYLLGLQLLENQSVLALEPVSVSSVLIDVAHELDGFAKQHNTRLRLHIAGRYQPVMAHHGGLRAALLAIGYALLESYSPERGSMTLAVHRTPRGIITGLYGDYEQLSAEQWRKAILLQGKAAQPFHTLTAGNGAGLFVADTIMRAMETTLRVGRYLKQQGLATTLQPSQQLQFV